MLKFVEHLFLLLVIGIVSYKNSLIIIYGILSSISILIWFITYYKRKKKNLSIKCEMDINVYFVGIAIIMVNLIYSIELVNLAFGFAYLILYIFNLIKYMIKNEQIIGNLKASYLCDFYSILYMAGLIMELAKYEL